MKCAHCGAALIEGLGTCYRCGLAAQAARAASWADVDDAPFTLPRSSAAGAPVRRPPTRATRAHTPEARAASSRVPLRAASWLAFTLAGLGILDALLGDDALVVPYALFHALAGLALRRRWRGGWTASVTLSAFDALFALIALAGGVLAASLVVGACSAGLLWTLCQRGSRAAFRQRPASRSARAKPADPHATLILPA